MSLSHNRRFIQIAFNGTAYQVRHVLPQIPPDPRILIEAGTPYIKREGMGGISLIRRIWRGMIVADMKTSDGAVDEVFMAANAGANAVTALGSAPTPTLNLFCEACTTRGVYSMIDMIGVDNPLKFLLVLKQKPDFVVIHKGRDEENVFGQIIRYKDISKIRSKFDIQMSVAGGIEPLRVRTGFFNGGDVVIVNVISSSDPNAGVSDQANFRQVIPEMLSEAGD